MARPWSTGRPGDLGEQRDDLRDGRRVAVDAGVGLLEGQARGQRQRAEVGVAAAQVAADDQDALVVDAARELRLALDVDDAGAARRRRRRDAGRLAERVVAQVVDGQAVDLAHRAPGGRDQQRALLEHRLQPLLHAAVALLAGAPRVLDVLALDRLRPAPPGQVRRLAHDVGHVREARRQAVAAVGQRGALLDDRAQRLGRRRQEPLARDDAGHHLGVAALRGRRARQVAGELGAHAEQLAEVGVAAGRARRAPSARRSARP